jgi:TP901 family phage tail tape measure protein
MAKYSSIFASISPGMDVDTATNGLVSIMKAYDIGNENPDDVLDGIMSKINIIGNTAATSNAEIVNMLSKSSSAMKEANNSLEETIALETAAVEITRDDDSVGQAYKTVSMRIRGYDEETESYTNDVEELSGKIADLTKTASTPGGISLFTDENKTEFKSTYQLLQEISKVYDQLSDKNQAQLLEVLAGKRQGQIVAATINNFQAAEKAMDNMSKSAGSAEKEMAVIVDSVDYKLNRLQQTGVAISQNLVQRKEMKEVIDLFNTLAEAVEWATDKLGLFGSLAAVAGAVNGIKNVGRDKMSSLLLLNVNNMPTTICFL